MTQPSDEDKTNPDWWNGRSQGRLPGTIGVQVTSIAHGRFEGRIEVGPHLLAPNGFLHAATVIGLADTLCGYGCSYSVPEGATGFTTIETKSNHLGTVRDGAISAVATLLHGGRMTQVWDCVVSDESNGKPIAMFRCTQMVLYPRA